MALETQVWLYGTRAGKDKSKKKLVRISSDDWAKARAFYLFVRKSPRSKWVRVTSEVEVIPSFLRSKVDREEYVNSFAEAIKIDLTPKPKKEAPKKEAPKKPAPKKKVKPVKEIEEVEEKESDLDLPDLPTPPRVTLTKKQFEAQVARILFDELAVQNVKWTNKRMDSLIKKLWRNYSGSPHLIVSEKFRRGIVTKEIKNYYDKIQRRQEGKMTEEFRKKLQQKKVTVDPVVPEATVDVKFKEVFNMQRLRKKDEQTIAVIEGSKIVEKDRQTAFVQVAVEYDKAIMIDAAAALGSKKVSEQAFSRLKDDMRRVFTNAMEKGLFSEGKEPEYAIRLILPMVDAKGNILKSYLNTEKQITTGYGYSTYREKVSSPKDLEKLLSGLFDGLKPIMAKYIRLNHAAGYRLSGFVIERILR